MNTSGRKMYGSFSDQYDSKPLLSKPQKMEKQEEKQRLLDSDYQSGGNSVVDLENVISDTEDPLCNRNVEHPTSNFDTMVHLLKGNIGTGILAMPDGFRNAGWVIGLFGTMIMGVICTHCMHMLVGCSRELCRRTQTPSLNFSEVVETAFRTGPDFLQSYAKLAKLVINIFLFITQLGFCCVYFVFVAANLQEVIKHYYVDVPVHWYLLILLIPLILLNWVKSLKYLTPASLFASIVMSMGLIITFFYMLQGLPAVSSVSAFASWSQLPLYFGTAIYAFEGIGVVLPLENNMKNPKDFGGWNGVLNTGMIIVAALYTSVGFFGYLKYGDRAVLGSVTLLLPADEIDLTDVEDYVEKHGTEVLKARDEWGYTPAHWAALDGNVEIMRFIVDRRAPIDLPCLGTQGPRPIHWACRKGHAAVVQVLLQAGVAVNGADFKGLTPLMTACMFGRTATAAYLLGMGAFNHLVDINGDTAMHWAAYKGHPDLLKLLMYSGANLQKPDHFGSTPLHLACLSGSLSCVKLLCEKNDIDLEPKDKNDKTPLMLAIGHRHMDIVDILHIGIKKRSGWLPPVNEIWGLLFGRAGNSKAPLVFFMSSVLLWGYPMYVIRVIPITWNILRGSHYCFIYWNVVMWMSWIVANRKNPGYIHTNSDSYYRSIKQIPYFDKWKKRNSMLNRLCDTCRTLRPMRAKHCRVCNRCVSYFDHHCPFIYNCVGLKNRTWFFIFVMSVAINCSFTIYFATYCIAIEGFGIMYVLGLVEAFVFSGLGWILTCTSVLHACMNLTTNEMVNYKRYPYLRDKRGRYYNPFSRGPILNLIEFFFCTPEDFDDDIGYEYI